jgi:uncharacterized protein (TIGR03435 family)
MLAIFLLSATLCQAAQPSFEVASVRTAPFSKGGGEHELGANIQTTPGSVTMRSVTLKTAVAWAYKVMETQVQGPAWVGFDRFDIAAKTPEPAKEEVLRVMLQPVLAERFELTVHRQTKEMQAYLLQVAKGGPKFHESEAAGDFAVEPNKERMSVSVHRASISQLVDLLSRVLQTPIVDSTGLTARYDVTLDLSKYMQDMRPADGIPDVVGILMTGLQQELGLKLESKKMPIDLVVIDQARKIPESN